MLDVYSKARLVCCSVHYWTISCRYGNAGNISIFSCLTPMEVRFSGNIVQEEAAFTTDLIDGRMQVYPVDGFGAWSVKI